VLAKEKGEPSFEAGFSLVVIVCSVCIIYTQNLLRTPNIGMVIYIGNTTTYLLVSLWSCWSMLCVVYVGDLGVPTRPTVFALVVLLRCWTVFAV